MASDSAAGAWNAGRKPQGSGFQWVSSSPSQAEVAMLESKFPDVVRVSVPVLEEEAAGWQRYAVLARSFSKWVPADAYIREFRRAGIAGAIVPVSLAFRCHIFRFDVQEAVDLVLNRPWVINGQIIGTEAWRQEFFPAENSISSALLWLRLPGLPMEFWKEEILRAISEKAGSFCCVDAATSSRTRGAFARVALRVDLSCPLRPGSRVQGVNGPFWQPFVYESLEGFCPSCGSLHLLGRCVPEVRDEAGVSDRSFAYGPWLAAVRLRRRAEDSPVKSPPYASAPSVAPLPGSVASPAEEGWSIPSKQGRRRPPVSVNSAAGSLKVGGEKVSSAPGAVVDGSLVPVSRRVVQSKGEGKVVSDSQSQALVPFFLQRAGECAGSSCSSKGKLKAGKDVGSSAIDPRLLKQAKGDGVGVSNCNSMVPVPVFQQRAISKCSVKGKLKVDPIVSSGADSAQSIISANPFAALARVPFGAGLEDLRVMGSAPLKRARPDECRPPRSISKSDKINGKGKVNLVNCRKDFSPPSLNPPQSLCCLNPAQEVEMSIPDRPADLECQDTPIVPMGQGPGDIAVDSAVLQDCSSHNTDSVMDEDKEVVPVISS